MMPQRYRSALMWAAITYGVLCISALAFTAASYNFSAPCVNPPASNQTTVAPSPNPSTTPPGPAYVDYSVVGMLAWAIAVFIVTLVGTIFCIVAGAAVAGFVEIGILNRNRRMIKLVMVFMFAFFALFYVIAGAVVARYASLVAAFGSAACPLSYLLAIIAAVVDFVLAVFSALLAWLSFSSILDEPKSDHILDPKAYVIGA